MTLGMDLFANLGSQKPDTELVLFSPYLWNERVSQLNCGPELVQHLGMAGMENIKFFTACRIAQSNGATHFLYIDETCRFYHPSGKVTWDRAIWDEFFTRRPHAAVGGSVVINNMTKDTLPWMRECKRMASAGPYLPVQFIGTHLNPSVYVNGPLAIYSTHWIREIFPSMDHTLNLCHEIHPLPYDQWIGQELRRRMGFDVFRSVLHMNTVVSTIEPGLLSTSERVHLIGCGVEEACAINQVT